MEEKRCSKCKELKLVSEFPKNRCMSGGLGHNCMLCTNELSRDYRRSKNGLPVIIYHHQQIASIKRNHIFPTYTMEELREWMFSQKLFHELYDNWKNSGYDSWLTPSCDRMDDYKPYTLSNLQLMTWRENNLKFHADKKNGVNNKANKSVIGTHLITGEIVRFYSACDAERSLNVCCQNISGCIRNKRRSSGGYKWELDLIKN